MDRCHKLLASASYQPQGVVRACSSTTESMNIDRFSYLPDPVAHHILSFLPIADLIRLGCVSKNCRELYLSSPSLNFEEFSQSNLFMHINGSSLMSCLDRFLFIHRGVKKIEGFRIRWNKIVNGEDQIFRMMTWIHNAVRCNVEVLHLELKGKAQLFPSFVFLCGSLKSLLVDMDCKILKAPSLTSFSNLEYLNLKHIHIEDEGIFKWISCCCKCIKELHLKHVRGIKSVTIESCSLQLFCFEDPYSSSLTRICHLNISGENLEDIHIDWGFDSYSSKLLNISAPNLKCLKWLGNLRIHQNLGKVLCLEKAELLLNPTEDDFVFEVLGSICRVEVLVLNKETTMALFKGGSMPAVSLENVCHLSIHIGSWLDILVPTMVSLFGGMLSLSTLKIKSDSLFLDPKSDCSRFNMGYWKSQNLPFIVQLKEATIQLSDGSNGIEFARFILEHSQNLKKMVIVHSPQQSNAMRKLNQSKMTSNATVIFLEDQERGTKRKRRVFR